MTLPKVSAGQDNPLRMAKHINAVADAVNYYQQIQLGKGQSARAKPLNTDCVMVKNMTGADLVRGHCVQLGDYKLTDLDPDNLWFEADDPADPVTLRYAILRQPIKTGDAGYWLAQVSGVCTAVVDVSDTAHRFATPVSGSHVLDSAASGPIELLQVPTGTGEEELVVRMMSVTTGVLIIEFTITDDSPLTGAVTKRPDGMETVPGEDSGSVDLVNPAGVEITVGEKGSAWYRDEEWSILNITHDCEE